MAQQIHDLPVHLHGSRLAHHVLRLLGWRLLFNGLPARRGILLVYPHTSNLDFPIVMLAKWSIGWPVSFLVKASLTRIPLVGRWMRWLGAVPVERGSAQGGVASMTLAMQQAQAADRFFWLGIAPEGTRGHGSGWRCGFYPVAVATGVPVVLVRLDWGRREVGVDSCWRVSGGLDGDLAQFAQALAGVQGRHPDQAAPVRAFDSTRSGS